MPDDTPGRVPIEPPDGWRVTYNTLSDIEPSAIEFTEPADHLLLTEDLLQVVHEEAKLVLDVGWYPDGDPDGRYRLVVVPGRGQDTDWGDPIQVYHTDRLAELREEIGEVLSSLP